MVVENKYWDTEEFVGETLKSETSKFLVHRCTRGGKNFITVREWYKTKTSTLWFPSKNGISLPNNELTVGIVSHIMEATIK
jgi:hypothetical protein